MGTGRHSANGSTNCVSANDAAIHRRHVALYNNCLCQQLLSSAHSACHPAIIRMQRAACVIQMPMYTALTKRHQPLWQSREIFECAVCVCVMHRVGMVMAHLLQRIGALLRPAPRSAPFDIDAFSSGAPSNVIHVRLPN